MFSLHVNDLSFVGMPYQAQVILNGPQNITDHSEIFLDSVQVHSGWTQYTADTIEEWFEANNSEPATDLAIKYFSSTSSEVVNSVFEGLGIIVDREQGLRNFTIEYFHDKNTL